MGSNAMAQPKWVVPIWMKTLLRKLTASKSTTGRISSSLYLPNPVVAFRTSCTLTNFSCHPTPFAPSVARKPVASPAHTPAPAQLGGSGGGKGRGTCVGLPQHPHRTSSPSPTHEKALSSRQAPSSQQLPAPSSSPRHTEGCGCPCGSHCELRLPARWWHLLCFERGPHGRPRLRSRCILGQTVHRSLIQHRQGRGRSGRSACDGPCAVESKSQRHGRAGGDGGGGGGAGARHGGVTEGLTLVVDASEAFTCTTCSTRPAAAHPTNQPPLQPARVYHGHGTGGAGYGDGETACRAGAARFAHTHAVVVLNQLVFNFTAPGAPLTGGAAASAG